jgi:membrane-associated phospholipid phosphatase
VRDDAAARAAWLSPCDKVVIAYLAIISALIVISTPRVPNGWLLLAAHAAVVAGILALAKYTGRDSLARGWYAVALVPLTYKELTYLIPLLHPRSFDGELAAIDYRMFGVHPTIWLERFMSPLLTEVLQLSYTTYYFLPLLLGGVLWRKRLFDKFHFLLFVIVLGFYLSYLGYIAVPATGPRFLPEIQQQQTRPLSGVLLFDEIHALLNRLEGKTYDAFPSGHTELTLLVLFYARRFHRPTFWALLPAGVGLIISTVYLRYHYVIDVIAGAVLALIIIAVARPLYSGVGGQKKG